MSGRTEAEVIRDMSDEELDTLIEARKALLTAAQRDYSLVAGIRRERQRKRAEDAYRDRILRRAMKIGEFGV